MIVYHNFNPETEIEFDCIKGRKETRKIAEKELRRKGCQSKTKFKGSEQLEAKENSLKKSF